MTRHNDPCWETNGRWNPTFIAGSDEPTLMAVLNGVHEDFRSDGAMNRFRVVMHRPGVTGPAAMIAVSFRLDALARVRAGLGSR